MKEKQTTKRGSKQGTISEEVSPSVVVEETSAGGRPTLYKEEYNEQARKLCLLGATDKSLADFFGIAESTLNLWKDAHPEFMESIIRGREIADAEIADSLYHRAKGYSHPDVHISSYEGEIKITNITKHYPPDTPAASLWLRNRRPKQWRDKQDIEFPGEDGKPQKIGGVFSDTERSARLLFLLEQAEKRSQQ